MTPNRLARLFMLTSALTPLAAQPGPDGGSPRTATTIAAEAQGIPRTDANSRRAHEQLLAKARQGRIDLYFTGDSITRRWGTSDPQYREMLANWTTNFYGWNAGNFGWGGDTVQHVLWRLTHGELDSVHPKVIVLLAGTNNLGGPATRDNPQSKVEEVVEGIRACLEVMREKAPATTIILMGILPRNEAGGGTTLMPTIRAINQRLARLADGRTVCFLDISDRLATPEGRLFAGMTVDGLHLSVKGYQVWADALKPMLTELLGPPGTVDLAPPPTGDPSLQKPEC